MAVINPWLSKRDATTDYKKVCAVYHAVLRQVTDSELLSAC